MLYYSKLTKKFYDSEKDCLDAEKKLQAQRAYQKSDLNPEKEELSRKIDEADKKLKESYNHYLSEKNRAVTVLNDAYDEYAKILNDAKQEIKNAQLNKYDALKKFNDKFGKYTVSYTENELNRFFNQPQSFFDLFF